MDAVALLTTLEAYCQTINVPPPRHPHFDIRTFEENMPTVEKKMPPFRHEFYAIALKSLGSGKAITGHNTAFPEGATVFFNSPFQLLSWDIGPDWQGYYIIFTQDFLAQHQQFGTLLDEFPFLKIDKATPFEIGAKDLPVMQGIFKRIYEEYHSEASDRFAIIAANVLLLLSYIRRYFNQAVGHEDATRQIRTANLKLISRFQTLLETSFYPNAPEGGTQLHSPSHYARLLNVHPNHLNAIVKEITGHTALAHIHKHVVQLAKAHLAQTQLSVKEIAYTLHFDSPNNFSAFFKKHTKETPGSYRKAALL